MKNEGGDKKTWWAWKAPAWLIEVWIVYVLVGFFVVRVLGSHLGQRVLAKLTHGAGG